MLCYDQPNDTHYHPSQKTEERGSAHVCMVYRRESPAPHEPSTPIDLSAWGAVYLFDDEEGLDESKQTTAPTTTLPAATPPLPAAPLGIALASIPPRQHPQATSLSDGSELRPPAASPGHNNAEVGPPLSLSLDRACSALHDVVAAARVAAEMLRQRESWVGLGDGLARMCHRRRGALAYAGACALAAWAQRGTVRVRPEPELNLALNPNEASARGPASQWHCSGWLGFGFKPTLATPSP